MLPNCGWIICVYALASELVFFNITPCRSSNPKRIGVPNDDDVEESDDYDGHILRETEEHIYAEDTYHDEEGCDPELVEAGD